MHIETEFIENSEQLFWMLNTKISNQNAGRIYPKFSSNVASGKSVAVYKCEVGNIKTKIAQLSYPDYSELRKKYKKGENIDLSYTYINDFSWLGDKKPYEVEGQPYKKIDKFSAVCSFWGNKCEEQDGKYIHIMQAEILGSDLDFSYACFNNLNFDFFNLKVSQGNLCFDYAKLYDSKFSLGGIECIGNRLFLSQVSFRYIEGENSEIDFMLFSARLSIDFLLAKMKSGKITIDGLPYGLNEVCFTKTNIEKLELTNAEIVALDIREANIKELTFTRCIFTGVCDITAQIEELIIESGVISNIFKINLTEVKELGFDNTLNNGKIYFKDFAAYTEALLLHINKSNCLVEEQILMLKENFRQLGQYSNEDLCHLRYQKLKTKNEKNILKKFGRSLIGLSSGYGTKPFNMLLLVLLFIAGFASVFYFVPSIQFKGTCAFFDYLYVSGITFFTVGYGDIVPANLATKLAVIVEAFCGVTTMSYFLVVLSRKVIR